MVRELDRHNLELHTNLLDTNQNRLAMMCNIFVKLMIQKCKTFVHFFTNVHINVHINEVAL